jgi:hypothetical protein
MTNIHDAQMSEEIMMRVKTVRLLRFTLASPVIGLFVIALLGVWADIIISFHDVMQNTMAHEGFFECVSYIYSSLIHSRTVVQIVALLIVTSVAGLLMSLVIRYKKSYPIRLYNFGLRG